jgi:Family of unknown function (DUF6544)
MTKRTTPVRDRAATYPRGFLRRAAAAQRTTQAPTGAVTEADLVGLPDASARYLRFMGVVGTATPSSLVAVAHGRFRMRPGARWMACRAWQYSTAAPLRRLFRMRLRMAPGLTMTGWDTYAEGSGRMRGTLFGVLPVASGSGPHVTTSELVTWLNDAVLLAPSMLLDPAVRMSGGESADAFRVEVTDGGRSVAAEVRIDGRGAPLDFQTDDRYADLPGGLVRARWHTPVASWVLGEGPPRPVGARAVWLLEGRPFTYAELEFDAIVHNPPPW